MKKLNIFKTLFFLGVLFTTLASGQSAQAQTCTPILGGSPGEQLCEPATSPLPTGCIAESGGGMICEAAPPGSTCPSCSSSRPTGTLTVSSASITQGKSVTLTWQTTNAVGCQIEGVGPVNPSGSRDVVVSQSTTFRLSCIEPNKPGATLEAIAQTEVAATPPTSNTAPTGQAPTTDGTLKYSPLEPLPGLENVSTVDFASMLNLLFKVFITVGALFAVGTLVWGGIMYMASGATGEIGEAKKRMQAAIYGLLLLAGSWLILNTINPQLLNFSLSLDPNATANQNVVPTSGSDSRASKEEKDACIRSGRVIDYEPGGGWECVLK